MNWRGMLRDVGIGLAILFVALLLFGQADRHQPEFSAADIRVIEGRIAEFTKVRVPETAGAPNRNRGTIRSRSAFRLTGHPPNLLAYIHGSPWEFENDIDVGTAVRLEVTEDPASALSQARAYPEGTFLLPIAGLQIGDHVYFRAIESVQRAEQAASRYQTAGLGALLLGFLWLGWTAWSHRHTLRAGLAAAREW